ncbi:MAG: hypothetical protein COA78_29435 [Blastopirellula sp.]|nr:MAG: hypothetical protein COA78_29435 [Blastopirellula sp.]
MSHIQITFSFLVVVSLTILSGVVYERTSRYDETSQRANEAAQKLNELPEIIGAWRLDTQKPLDETAERILQCNGYLNNTYVNDTTGQFVHVAVLLGPTGPISVHTPEICYSSRDYDISEDRNAISISEKENGGHTLWSLDLLKKDLQASKLRVYYAWSFGEKWEATEEPRYYYAGKPFLYKIQLACSVPAVESEDEIDAGQEFLKQFLPALQKQLVIAE